MGDPTPEKSIHSLARSLPTCVSVYTTINFLHLLRSAPCSLFSCRVRQSSATTSLGFLRSIFRSYTLHFVIHACFVQSFSFFLETCFNQSTHYTWTYLLLQRYTFICLFLSQPLEVVGINYELSVSSCLWVKPGKGAAYQAQLLEESVTPVQCDARATIVFSSVGHYHPLLGTNLYCSVTKARVWTTWLRLLPEGGTAGSWSRDIGVASPTPNHYPSGAQP